MYKKCAGLSPVYLKKAARCWFAASKDIAEDRSYAIKLLTNAENCDPSFFEAKAEKANLLFLEGKRSKGLSLCEEIIKNELPKCPEHMSILEEFHYAHSDMGTLFKLGDENDKLRLCQRVFLYICSPLPRPKKRGGQGEKHYLHLRRRAQLPRRACRCTCGNT
ncbi:MAG: hypothetical protein LRY51_11880 [Geovibrio sp.]|nr:hypothetical protein [Geovibrio sp.]